MTMITLDSQDARRNWRAMLDGVFSKASSYTIERHKSPIAVVLPVEEYERLKLVELALIDKRFDELKDDTFGVTVGSRKELEDLIKTG